MSQDEKKQYLEKLRADPEIGKVIDFIEDQNTKHLGQVKDPMSCFQTGRFSNFSVDQLLPFLSTSPTARKYMKACKHYLEGRTTLDVYGKQNIESEKHCDILQKSFRNYSIGLMTENALIRDFFPPVHIFSLLDEYLIHRPSDVFAQHFKVCMILRKVDKRVSKYDSYKEKIIAGERLAEKLRPYSDMVNERLILKDVYYMLASLYVVTDQYIRACDCFEKCYKLDKSDFKPLYGIGYTKEQDDPNEAMKLYHKFLEMAPKCDSQYPHVLYQLGNCYMIHFRNKIEALKYYNLGLRAEKEDRLPFEGVVDVPQKSNLKMVAELQKSLEAKKKH